MRVWLIRHGETELGASGRYQGALDTPLSARGRQRLRPADLTTDVVYVSPLRRAAETSAILFPKARQIVVDDLREMDFGVFEGRGWWEMEHDAAYRAWVDGGCLGACPGGEGRQSFSERVCAAFQKLVDEALIRGEETLVIVAHGGTQMAILERWGTPPRDYYDWKTGYGGGVVLEGAEWPSALTLREEVDFSA